MINPDDSKINSLQLFRNHFDPNMALAIFRLLSPADQLKFAYLDRQMSKRMADRIRFLQRQKRLIDHSIFNFSPELFFKDINPTEMKIFRLLINHARQQFLMVSNNRINITPPYENEILDNNNKTIVQLLFRLLRISDTKEFFNQPVETREQHFSQRNPVVLIMYQKMHLKQKIIDSDLLTILNSAITIILKDHPLGSVAYSIGHNNFKIRFTEWLCKLAPDMPEINKNVFTSFINLYYPRSSYDTSERAEIQRTSTNTIINIQKILLKWQEKFNILSRMQIDDNDTQHYIVFFRELLQLFSPRLEELSYEDLTYLAANKSRILPQHLRSEPHELIDLNILLSSEYLFTNLKNNSNRAQFEKEITQMGRQVSRVSDILLLDSNPQALTFLKKYPAWLLNVLEKIIPNLYKIKEINISTRNFIELTRNFFQPRINTKAAIDHKKVQALVNIFVKLLRLTQIAYFKEVLKKLYNKQAPGKMLIEFLSAYDVSYKYIQKFPVLFALLDQSMPFEPNAVCDAINIITTKKHNEILLEYLLIQSTTLKDLADKLHQYPLAKLESKMQDDIFQFFDICEFDCLRDEPFANSPNLNMLDLFVIFLNKIKNFNFQDLIFKIYPFFNDTESTIKFLTVFYSLAGDSYDLRYTGLLEIIFKHLPDDAIMHLFTLLQCEERKRSQYLNLFVFLMKLLNKLTLSNTFVFDLVKHTLVELSDQMLRNIEHTDLIEIISVRARIDNLPEALKSLFKPDIITWLDLYNKIPATKHTVFRERFNYICQKACKNPHILEKQSFFPGGLDTFVECILNDNFYFFFCKPIPLTQMLFDVHSSDWTQYSYYFDFLAVVAELNCFTSVSTLEQMRAIIDSGLLKLRNYTNFKDCILFYNVTDLLLLQETFADNDIEHTYSLLELVVSSSQFKSDYPQEIPTAELIKQKEVLFKMYPKNLSIKLAAQISSSPPASHAITKQGLFKTTATGSNKQQSEIVESLDKIIEYFNNFDTSTYPITKPLQKRLETISTLSLGLAKRKPEQEAEPALPSKLLKLEDKSIEDNDEQQSDSISLKCVR